MLFHRKTENVDSCVSSKKGKVAKSTQKILMSLLLVSGIGTTLTQSTNAKSDDLSTVFHIYSDEEYIGVVSDELKLKRAKQEKLEQARSEYDHLNISVQENYSVIPERVFSVEEDDKLVLDELAELLVIEAEAIAVTVDGEPVLYVQSEKEYEEVIKQLKLQTMTEEELVRFEAQENATSSLPELKKDETRVTNVFMTAELASEESSIVPDQMRTVDEAVQILNNGSLEEKKYEIQKGDVIGQIANEHDMSTAELIELNPNLTEDTIIQPGVELNVTISEPYVEVQAHFEAKKTKSISYKKVTEKDSSLLKGEKKVKQKGSTGEKVVTERIRKMNGEVIGKSVQKEEVIAEPVDEIVVVGTKEMPSRGGGKFQWPTVGGYVSSPMGARWGRMHRGIDIARPSSRSILAADNGVIIAAGSDGSYGNRIIINHNNGYQTLYAHLSSIDVSVGQTVSQGQTIGIMGSTGRSTGVHLHFEVTKNGSLINPMTVLR